MPCCHAFETFGFQLQSLRPVLLACSVEMCLVLRQIPVCTQVFIVNSRGRTNQEWSAQVFSVTICTFSWGYEVKREKEFFSCAFFFFSQKLDLKCIKVFSSQAIFNSSISRCVKAAALELIVESAFCRSAFCVLCWQGFKCVFKG